MAESSFYYDGSLCIACRGCQVACKQWNNLPAEKTQFFAEAGGYQNPADLSPTTWTLIKFHETYDKAKGVDWQFRRHHCFHCTDAACIEACPVDPKAMTRHPEFGTVFVNQELCIGCGACEEACPYGVPHVNEDTEKSYKCTGCRDRVAEGLLPACAKTCPTNAIRYGSKKEMYALAKERVKELKKMGFKDANLYGLEQLGGLRSIYVLPAKL
ncbi:MAG: 4Fe-4S dicluster domain-containing protein, partial [Candidatus Eisenbacteria sp.]|nr:4Fe-4S dicluster domain-containing protein [Candidatus Eisenbacteria bacterium]